MRVEDGLLRLSVAFFALGLPALASDKERGIEFCDLQAARCVGAFPYREKPSFLWLTPTGRGPPEVECTGVPSLRPPRATGYTECVYLVTATPPANMWTQSHPNSHGSPKYAGQVVK